MRATLRSALAVLAIAVVLAPAAPASAAQLAGVSLSDSVEVGGQMLVLNGMGLREKFFVDVYVAGLYLPGKQRSEQAIFDADAPRQVVMHFVHDVSKQQICEAWNESLAANHPGASAAVKKGFETLCSWMEDVEEGDRMVFSYVPGSGTTVEVAGQDKGTIEGKEFADALFASWIGEHPATAKLKKGLLGG